MSAAGAQMVREALTPGAPSEALNAKNQPASRKLSKISATEMQVCHTRRSRLGW
jgi:hypothetical protein